MNITNNTTQKTNTTTTTTTTTTAGHDIKSLALNLAMIILFVLPFAIYYYPEYLKEEIGVMVGGFVIAFITPPYGVLRPHPYSDSEHNKPFLFRKSKSVGAKNE
jgi:hypothetical protein